MTVSRRAKRKKSIVIHCVDPNTVGSLAKVLLIYEAESDRYSLLVFIRIKYSHSYTFPKTGSCGVI